MILLYDLGKFLLVSIILSSGMLWLPLIIVSKLVEKTNGKIRRHLWFSIHRVFYDYLEFDTSVLNSIPWTKTPAEVSSKYYTIHLITFLACFHLLNVQKSALIHHQNCLIFSYAVNSCCFHVTLHYCYIFILELVLLIFICCFFR